MLLYIYLLITISHNIIHIIYKNNIHNNMCILIYYLFNNLTYLLIYHVISIIGIQIHIFYKISNMK